MTRKIVHVQLHDDALAAPEMLEPDMNPVTVYLNSLTSELSRYTMRNALRTIIAMTSNKSLDQVTDLDMLQYRWSGLRYQHTAAIRARVAGRYSPASANRMLSALRGVLKESWRLGYITAEEYQRAVDIQNVKAHHLPAGRNLANAEVSQLLQACKADDTPAGVRDFAIIALLYSCGLRRSELVNLRCEDLDLENGALKVRMGKGRKQRLVYIAGSALRALAHWRKLHAIETGALFVPILKSGKLLKHGMVSQSIYDMLKKRAKQAGIKQFSPHDLRRTFVGDMLDLGVDIATVANIAGHSSIDTTRRYDRRPETIKKQAAEKLVLPE